MVHVIGVNWSMLGRGGQKSPKNGPHGLRMPPKEEVIARFFFAYSRTKYSVLILKRKVGRFLK